MERIVSPLSFAAMQRQGLHHHGSSPVLNAAAAAAVAAQLSFSQQDSGENGAVDGRAVKYGATGGSVAVGGGHEGARMEEMDQIDEEIHQLDRRINRVYEEEALKAKLADVEAEIKRFELGNRRTPIPNIPDADVANERRGEQERLAAAGLLGAAGGMNVGAPGVMDLPGTRNMDDDAISVSSEVRPHHPPQPPPPHPPVSEFNSHELSLARQMVFDQQMLAVARQMMELQQEAAMGGDPATQMQSLNLYPMLRGMADMDFASSNRAPSIASSEMSLSDVASGGANGGARGPGPAEGTPDNLSASEQRQWQRLQRQFDKPETVSPETDNTVPEFTVPFSPSNRE